MAAPFKMFQTRIVAQTNRKPTASLICLHGSGDTGTGIMAWMEALLEGTGMKFPHIRVLYPTAPMRPYTPCNNIPTNVWYNRERIHPSCEEDLESVDHMCKQLKKLVVGEQILTGVPDSRLIIGGFSMGGGIALQLVYRHFPNVAGVFALSSFLSEKCTLYQEIKDKPKHSLPPLFQAHGKQDPLVLYEWGQDTHEKLRDSGLDCQFHTYSDLAHEMSPEQLQLLRQWIMERVPEKPED